MKINTPQNIKEKSLENMEILSDQKYDYRT